MPDGEMKPESLNVNREPLTGGMPARDLGAGDELPFLGSGAEAGAAALGVGQAGDVFPESGNMIINYEATIVSV